MDGYCFALTRQCHCCQMPVCCFILDAIMRWLGWTVDVEAYVRTGTTVNGIMMIISFLYLIGKWPGHPSGWCVLVVCRWVDFLGVLFLGGKLKR